MKLDYIHLGDCLEWLKTLPDRSVDVIWTDPPYGNNNKNGKDLQSRIRIAKGEIGEEVKEDAISNDSPEEMAIVVRGMLEQANRVLKKNGCCCCCCCGGGGGGGGGGNAERIMFARVAEWVDEFLEFDQAVVWDKGGLGIGWRYRRNYEFVMVAHPKGGAMKWEKDTADMECANVVRIPKEPFSSEHPTPKPVALVKHFLRLHAKQGDVICDPFMGGGTTAVAAVSMGMHYIGCEIDPKWHRYAEQRIAKMDGAQFDDNCNMVRSRGLFDTVVL